MTPNRCVSVSAQRVPSGRVVGGTAELVVVATPVKGCQGLASTTVPTPLVTVMFGTTLTMASGIELLGIDGSEPGADEENAPATSTTFQFAVLSPGSVTCATM